MNVWENRNRLTDTEDKLVVSSGESEGWMGKIGVKDHDIQTTRYKTNKQQWYIVQHMKIKPLFLINLNGI